MATLLRWILEILFRPTGKHRATAPVPVRPVHPLLGRPKWFPPIDGDATAMVRPYLLAHEQRVHEQRVHEQRVHEQRVEAHRQRERRRALVLATMGIDYVGVA